MRSPILICIAALASINPNPTRADLLLDLRFDDSTTSRVVNSGDTVLIDLILSDTDNSNSELQDGLVSGGGRLLQSSGAAVLNLTSTNADPGFDGSTSSPGGGPANEVAAILATTDFFSPAVGIGSSLISVARFAFIVTGNAGDTATIDSAVLDPTFVFSGNTTDFPSGVDLDALFTGFGSVNISIAAVPEPSTLIMGMLMAVGGCVIWKRRRNVVVTE